VPLLSKLRGNSQARTDGTGIIDCCQLGSRNRIVGDVEAKLAKGLNNDIEIAVFSGDRLNHRSVCCVVGCVEGDRRDLDVVGEAGGIGRGSVAACEYDGLEGWRRQFADNCTSDVAVATEDEDGLRLVDRVVHGSPFRRIKSRR
tara:strand:- start:980 stop:1411 length:432 start_codon:yes stop_codon:yes gene_type:complete